MWRVFLLYPNCFPVLQLKEWSGIFMEGIQQSFLWDFRVNHQLAGQLHRERDT